MKRKSNLRKEHNNSGSKKRFQLPHLVNPRSSSSVSTSQYTIEELLRKRESFYLINLSFEQIHVMGPITANFAYLTGVYWTRDKRSLWEELRCTQQIPHSFKISFIFFDWFQFHLLFWKQCFITGSIASRRQKFKLSMTSAQQETNSAIFNEAIRLLNSQHIPSLWIYNLEA